MIQQFNVDNANERDKLYHRDPAIRTVGVVPRREDLRYGSQEAYRTGLTPVEADLALIPKDQYKASLEQAYTHESLPMHHQKHTWAPPGFQYNQNGLGYCWTWGGTGCLMTTRAMEDKDTVLLAPVSMGYLVNWANRGNYLESYIRGAREDGVCPAVNGEINSHTNSSRYWDNHDTDRSKYRLDKIWDTDSRNGDARMIQHCLSILCYGRSLYIAYNWWGHALECVGLRWDESKPNNLVWIIRNSHNESDFIELVGSKGVPDEAYGFVSTKQEDAP